MKDDITRAFPIHPLYTGSGSKLTFYEGSYGMTLRDYFASKAMQGWLGTYGDRHSTTDVSANTIANFAYNMADEMLKARR
jgi:hypothetical protein